MTSATRKDAGALGEIPWVVVAPQGVIWLGHAKNEASAWRIALGWPSAEEIAEKKAAGWYATTPQVTWTKP